MASVGGEGRVRHRAASVFGNPPQSLPCRVGFSGCSLYILFGSPATFCLHSSRLVCVLPSVHAIQNGIYYGHALSSHPRSAERDRPDSGSPGLASWCQPLQPCRV